MSRFEEASPETVNLVRDVMEESFPELQTARMVVLYDTKKRKSGGKFVIGRMKKTNDELKAFATDPSGDSYDYIMFLDKLVFEAVDENDKKYIIFHELCHCQIDLDSSDQFKIKDHEIQTFYSEMEYTKDNPRWLERVSAIAESLHNPVNE